MKTPVLLLILIGSISLSSYGASGAENSQAYLSLNATGNFPVKSWQLSVVTGKNNTVMINSFSFEDARMSRQYFLMMTVNAFRGEFNTTEFARADVTISAPYFVVGDNKLYFLVNYITHQYAKPSHDELEFLINLTNTIRGVGKQLYEEVANKSNTTEEDFVARGTIDLNININKSIGIIGGNNFLRLGLTTANLSDISLDVAVPEEAEQFETTLDGESIGKILPNRRKTTIANIPSEQTTHEVYLEWAIPKSSPLLPLYEQWPWKILIGPFVGFGIGILFRDIIYGKVLQPLMRRKKTVKPVPTSAFFTRVIGETQSG